jgi:hypothetical protein
MGWYPVIESRIDYGNSLYIEKFREDIADPADVFNGYEWTNNVYFPLSFRGGRFTKYLYLSGSSTLRNDYIYLKSRGIYDNLQNQLTGRIIFSVYQRSALRDIYTRLALTLDLSYSDYPFDRDIYGDILTARTSFFIPGLLKNNSIRLRLEAEKQNPEKFILGNRASFARGYIGARTFNDDAWFHNIISQELQTVSADYFMPLVYPDLNIPGILFLSRIRADMFFDYTRGFNNYVFISDINEQGVREIKMENHDYREVFSSFGVQLMADYYLFRIPFMISSGVETAWREPGGYPYIKLLFSVDLFGMNIGKRKTRGLI